MNAPKLVTLKGRWMAIEITQQSVKDLLFKELDEGRGYDAITQRFHNSVIVAALTRADKNISRAAVLLKVHRNTLSRWMHESGLDQHFPEGNGQEP